MIKEKLDSESLKYNKTKTVIRGHEVSLGHFHTKCITKGTKHKLVFIVAKVEPLLSDDTCQWLGLIKFTIPEELHGVSCSDTPLTKQQLTSNFKDAIITCTEGSL